MAKVRSLRVTLELSGDHLERLKAIQGRLGLKVAPALRAVVSIGLDEMERRHPSRQSRAPSPVGVSA